MAEELDYKTFDLGKVLAGIDYPETDVSVYFDEKLGFTINRLREAIDEADRRDNTTVAAELQKELDSLVEKVSAAKYTVHLKGIPEGERKAILNAVRSDMPPTKNVWGQEEDNPAADQEFMRRLWRAMIVKIVDPEGAVSVASDETVQLLQEKAPRTAQMAITNAVSDLLTGSAEGFEYAAKQADFLSIASPEG